MEDVYWRPACEAVFAGSAKPGLALATPGVLRKAAVTFWLESGTSPLWVSSRPVTRKRCCAMYYAGRASASLARESTLLTNHARATRSAGRRPPDG